MRKITSFYYLNYPDCQPSDPFNAFSEMYVEVGSNNSTVNNFEDTYSFQVFTVNCLKEMLAEKDYLLSKSILVVTKFDDLTIKKVLEEIVDKIEFYGTKISSD